MTRADDRLIIERTDTVEPQTVGCDRFDVVDEREQQQWLTLVRVAMEG
jgi:hypothetical protein